MTMTREEAKHHLKRVGEKVGRLAMLQRQLKELGYQIASLEAELRDMQSKAADAAAVLSSEAP
jgi:chaperonin cofactor prefoldin